MVSEGAELTPLPLTREKYSERVVRELTDTELGQYIPSETFTTPEGFVLGGENETSRIRELGSINGVNIRTLEERMRPLGNKDIPRERKRERMSNAGFLGEDESLLDILVEDNDTVHSLGTTHKELAKFLMYFQRAQEYLEQQGLIKEWGKFPAYEKNGRTYRFFPKGWAGYQDSPFHDGALTSHDYKLICIEDGSRIAYSGLLPHFIFNYGFYEGKRTGYRLDPKKIARVSGMDPIPDDDPVVRLMKNPSDQAQLRTNDEISRFFNLYYPYLENSNFHFSPEDLGASFTLLRRVKNIEYEKQYGKEGRSEWIQNLIRDRISFDQISPGRFEMKGGVFGEEDYLFKYIPETFPELMDSLLERITTIKLDPNHEFNAVLLNNLIEACLDEESGRGQYYKSLLFKIETDPTVMVDLLTAISWRVKPSIPRKEIPNVTVSDSKKFDAEKLAQLFEEAMPEFKERVLGFYDLIGYQYDKDQDLTSLVQGMARTNPPFIKDTSFRSLYQEIVKDSIEFARNIGGRKDVTREDMGRLVFLIMRAKKNPEYKPNEDELESLRRLGVDSRILPYAIKSPNAVNTKYTISQLFNGTAEKAFKASQIYKGSQN